jgi:hypothetical protein
MRRQCGDVVSDDDAALIGDRWVIGTRETGVLNTNDIEAETSGLSLG